MREALNPVILMGDIMDEITERGAWVEIECVESLKRGEDGRYLGAWKVHVCTPTGSGDVIRATHVTVRSLAPRIFRTPDGLLGLATELGTSTLRCPLLKGAVDVWTFETSRMPAAE
jgi:hypothetical protein